MDINDQSSSSNTRSKSALDQIVWTTTSTGDHDHLLLQGSSNSKSYTCFFCKRGFSNAQALGGHMNIHRRDRARLKEASEETLLSLEVTTSTTNPSIDKDKKLSQLLEESNNQDLRSCTPKEADATSGIGTDRGEDNKLQLGSHRNLSRSELDLELRLGPDPDHDQTPTKRGSARDFF